MTLTVKGKKFTVQILYPLRKVDELMIVYEDSRSISEIAADWEGAESVIETDAAGLAVNAYEGFSVLKRIVREEGNNIQIGLVKGVNV